VPSQRKLRKVQLKEKVCVAYAASKGRYGSPRIAKELNMQGASVSRTLVAKLMKEENIRSIIKKKFKVTTHSSHSYAVVEDKLARNLMPPLPNTAWVSDMVDTVIPAFRMASANRYLDKSHNLHSDRGVQYACGEFVSKLGGYPNATRSMSRKGDCLDNAVAESFFKTLKVELVNHEKYSTRQKAMLSIFDYIETFYNTTRRHSQLGNLNEFYKLNNQLKNAA
jgi:putative transposase